MYAICVESSHQKGMGHFFRAINFIDFLKEKGKEAIVLINGDARSLDILREMQVRCEIVPLNDLESGWESVIIKRHNIDVWINDRLNTDIRHSRNIKNNGVVLVTLDDEGSGADLSDAHFLSLFFNGANSSRGRKVFKGLEFQILNKEIRKNRKVRKSQNHWLVTMGGSDTYSVTLKIVNILKALNKSATVIIGPAFREKEKLEELSGEFFKIKEFVPSLIQEFGNYDVAVTGGGITPVEANATGLPCIIVANEIFEIPNAKNLEKIGSSIFAGHHESIHAGVFSRKLDIEAMSQTGLSSIPINGAERVFEEIQKL